MALGQPLEAARGQARWCPGRQAQVGEESRNHRRLNDGGNDLQGAAALRAVFEIDIEDALEQARPTHARGRRLRMGMIG